MSLVIHCDWLHRIAKVTATFTDSNAPEIILEKDVEKYKIISDDPNKVCLLLNLSTLWCRDGYYDACRHRLIR
jgi:hypothetical protein